MSRLLENGLVQVDGIEAGSGPERKRYAKSNCPHPLDARLGTS